MSAEEKPKCCAKVYGGGYWPHSCGRNAKVERDGRHYCGTHDPEAVKLRREKNNAEWQAKHNAERALWAEQRRLREQEKFKASMFDEMLDALKMVRDYVVTMKGKGHEYQIVIDAAIAKATNHQGNNHD